MATIGEDLLTYLKAYNTEDHAKLTQSDDVPESLIMAIYNKHKTYFEAWRKVPTEFRDASGRVPDELMTKALNGETINKNTVQKDKQLPEVSIVTHAQQVGIILSDADTANIASTAAHIAILGYSLDAAQKLATNKTIREKISQKLKSGQPLSEGEENLWRATRENDAKTIEEDWKMNQPERYAIHIMKKLNSGKIPPELALPEIEKYLSKTANLNRTDHLYTELQRQKARLDKMRAETKSAISTMMKEQGLDNSILTKIGILRGTIAPKQELSFQNALIPKPEPNALAHRFNMCAIFDEINGRTTFLFRMAYFPCNLNFAALLPTDNITVNTHLGITNKF